jgi:uncharacterized protein YyaL (SSP411 family)
MIAIEDPLKSLINWIESNEYKGYDPYDFISAPLFSYVNNESVFFYGQQIGKRIPFNIRKWLQIKRETDPKGLSLFVLSYLKLYRATQRIEYLEKAETLHNYLLRLKSPNHFAWGFSFPWASRGFYLKAYDPNIVVTCFAGLATLELYEVTKRGKYLDACNEVLRFIFSELHEVYNDGEKICISYIRGSNLRIADANMLAAELIGRFGKMVGDDSLLTLAKKMVAYVDAQQHERGYWLYGYLPDGSLIDQLDYHQGFMIDSYYNLIKAEAIEYDNIKKIIKAADFYKKNLFTEEGASYYRYPRKYPVDIHNQAQGIISFHKMSLEKPEYQDFAKKIALWTIKNMQDENGYFYYQKWPFFINKIPYMRWSQAWIMLALTCLSEKAVALR